MPPYTDNDKASKHDTEIIPQTIIKEKKVITTMVNRLYSPSDLLRRTNEEKRRREKNKQAEYHVARDRHLQEYWHKRHIAATTFTTSASRRTHSPAKRLPPLSASDTHPSTSSLAYSSLDSPKTNQNQLVTRPESSVLDPLETHSGPLKLQDYGLMKRDLTALSILIDPPIHFQSRVHQLALSSEYYDLAWIRRFQKGGGGLGEVEGAVQEMPLLTLEDIPLAPEALRGFRGKQKRYLRSRFAEEADTPQEPEHGRRRPFRCDVYISSPRSALCCLRSGVPPKDLLPKDREFFEKEVGLEGAPTHVVSRRYEHFEKERLALLQHLRKMYATLQTTLPLAQCLRLLRKFNPENNFDVTLQGDMQNVADYPTSTPRQEGEGEESGGGEGCAEVEETPAATAEVEGGRELATQGEGRVRAERALQVGVSKEEHLREKCRLTLEKAKEKLQGHLVRTILLKRMTQKKADERAAKMQERLKKYSEERSHIQESRQTLARRKAEACRLVVEESKALAEARHEELIKQQEEANIRRLEVTRLRKFTREINREEATLRVKSKRENIVRQQNLHEWHKLCLLDRIRRRTDKSAYTEKCLTELLSSNKYEREVMLRENEAVMKALQGQLL